MAETKDTGPLDWRISITDPSGRPTPEFQRRWNTQRGNNALIGTITFGSGEPPADPVPADGALYADTSEEPEVLYVGFAGVWNKAGVTDFTELHDVPSTYDTAAGKLVRVNGGQTALEFTDPPAFANPTAVAGPTAINGSGNLFMRSNAAPAVQTATTGQLGLVRPDGTTITISGGVISSAGGGGGGSPEFLVPLASTFPTILNSAVLIDSDVGLGVRSPGNGVAVNLFGAVKSQANVDFTITARIAPQMQMELLCTPGIIIKSSATGKSLVAGYNRGQFPVFSGWNSDTSLSGNIAFLTPIFAANFPFWCRLTYVASSGLVSCFHSWDGVNWIACGSSSTWLGGTADLIGVVAGCESSLTNPAAMAVTYWKVT